MPGVTDAGTALLQSLQPFTRQRWYLVGACLQLQIADQSHTAFPVQGCMNLFDNGKDVSS